MYVFNFSSLLSPRDSTLPVVCILESGYISTLLQSQVSSNKSINVDQVAIDIFEDISIKEVDQLSKFLLPKDEFDAFNMCNHAATH